MTRWTFLECRNGETHDVFARSACFAKEPKPRTTSSASATRSADDSSSAISTSSQTRTHARILLPLLLGDAIQYTSQVPTSTMLTELRRKEGVFRHSTRGANPEHAYRERIGRHAVHVCVRDVRRVLDLWNVLSRTERDLASSDLRAAMGNLEQLYKTVHRDAQMPKRRLEVCLERPTCGCFSRNALHRADLGWMSVHLLFPPDFPRIEPHLHHKPWFWLKLQDIRAVCDHTSSTSSETGGAAPADLITLACRRLDKLSVRNQVMASFEQTIPVLSPYLAGSCRRILVTYDESRVVERLLRAARDIYLRIPDDTLYDMIRFQSTKRASIGLVVSKVVTFPIESLKVVVHTGYVVLALSAYFHLLEYVHQRYGQLNTDWRARSTSTAHQHVPTHDPPTRASRDVQQWKSYSFSVSGLFESIMDTLGDPFVDDSTDPPTDVVALSQQ